MRFNREANRLACFLSLLLRSTYPITRERAQFQGRSVLLSLQFALRLLYW
jgi:hypothetical protein